MVSPVKSRLTHYDNLGLTPAATPDEIAEAFAKRISITITSPEEAVEHANRIYVAYETLRDPVSRRAYDAAIALWDREATAEQKLEPFIAVSAGASPEHAMHDASPGPTPGPAKDAWKERGAKKRAIEWPVPDTKSLEERTATHVDTGAAVGGKREQAKKARRRASRVEKSSTDREPARGTLDPAKKRPRAARRASRAAIDREALGGTPAPAKKRRWEARRASKATLDRTAPHAATARRKSAIERTADPMREELRDDALDHSDQLRSVAPSDRPATSRFAAAGAGVIIAVFGILTLVVGLVRGNYDQTPNAPRRPIATVGQPSIPSTEKETAEAEQALAADETQSEAKSEASSINSLAESGRQVREAPRVAADTRALVDLLVGTPPGQTDDQATGAQYEQNPSRKAAVTPSPQSVTGQSATSAPQQQQMANRQPARTPPQPVPYRRTSSAAHGNPSTQEDASTKVSSSGIEGTICTHLPLTGTRVPQRVCLTKKEWKQVEEEQRYARTPPQPVPYRRTSFAAHGKPSTQEDASTKVTSSGIEGTLCTHLPLTGTRVPQRVCLTKKEWKQVEEAQR
jgi:curved DNA-binding protein CbpA